MMDDRVPGRRAVKILLVASVMAISMYMVNLLLTTLAEPPPSVGFVVYRAHYNSTDGSVTAWLDQNGTIPAYNVRVFVDWGTEWSFDRVDPQEFIRIRFEKRLEASDLPCWEELYIEWEYLDGVEGLKRDDGILFIILTRNDIIT
jgi:hypothetical protein